MMWFASGYGRWVVWVIARPSSRWDPAACIIGFSSFSSSLVGGTFSCTLKFIVKDCDPNTGEADDEGYEDEYVVSEWPLSPWCRKDHLKPVLYVRHS